MGLIVPYHHVSRPAGRKHKILATYAVPNSNSLQILLERTRTAIHANIALALLGSSQTATSPPPAGSGEGSTDGTVSFTGNAFALGAGFQWGSSTLSLLGGQ